jgi:hypothetical protein
MIRTQISLDRGTYERAKVVARRQGISLAELFRRALAKEILPANDGRAPWMRFAGSVRSGDPDASESIDEIVYGRERP